VWIRALRLADGRLEPLEQQTIDSGLRPIAASVFTNVEDSKRPKIVDLRSLVEQSLASQKTSSVLFSFCRRLLGSVCGTGPANSDFLASHGHMVNFKKDRHQPRPPSAVGSLFFFVQTICARRPIDVTGTVKAGPPVLCCCSTFEFNSRCRFCACKCLRFRSNTAGTCRLVHFRILITYLFVFWFVFRVVRSTVSNSCKAPGPVELRLFHPYCSSGQSLSLHMHAVLSSGRFTPLYTPPSAVCVFSSSAVSCVYLSIFYILNLPSCFYASDSPGRADLQEAGNEHRLHL
jgi:hypothetical protein